MAQGNAFVAQADDPSAIFYNPAGLTQLRRPQIYAHTVFSSTNRSYVSPGSYTTAAIKSFSFLPPMASSPSPTVWSWALGSFSPFGLGTTWPPTWAGRYLTTLSDLKTFNLNPVAAYKGPGQSIRRRGPQRPLLQGQHPTPDHGGTLDRIEERFFRRRLWFGL
jgi:long-chain fatty acid transport protein